MGIAAAPPILRPSLFENIVGFVLSSRPAAGRGKNVTIKFVAGVATLIASAAVAHDETLREINVWSLAWIWDVSLLAGLGLSAWLYINGASKLWRQSNSGIGIRRREVAAYAIGWASLAVALLSPLDPLGNRLFSAHMIQHELLMLVTAPLLILGQPLAYFAWALSPISRRRIGKAVRNVWLQRIWRSLTRPAIAWTLHAAMLWIWHAPPLFQRAIEHDGVHVLQHASFLLSALIFWWTLLRRRSDASSNAAALVYIFTTAIHTGVLGALLTFSPRVWYPMYLDTAFAWGLTPIEDQQLGGLIMWVPGGLVYLAAGLALAARLIGQSESAGTGARHVRI